MTTHDFDKAADRVMQGLFARLTQFDPDELDCDLAMGVLSMQFSDGKKFILNRQGAAQQIWLAHGVNAYHFAREPESGEWLDTKGRGKLGAILARAISDKLGRVIEL